MNYDQIAQKLDDAAIKANAIAQISSFRKLNLEEAYAIQAISIGRRYKRGEKFMGLKLGFTSKAKMEQMGVHDMIWGRLTNQMTIQKGGDFIKSKHVHPRAEPEIAFRISETIYNEQDLDSIKSVVDGVAVAIEVIDSRYENFKFSLEDVIADNCSSTGYCIGEWFPVSTSIEDKSIRLVINGDIQHEGNTNAILGNPWESMIAACRLALAHGIKLEKGHIIFAGAATAAVFLQEGQKVSAEADGLGSVHFNVK